MGGRKYSIKGPTFSTMMIASREGPKISDIENIAVTVRYKPYAIEMIFAG
jgi:hypothetical protein